MENQDIRQKQVITVNNAKKYPRLVNLEEHMSKERKFSPKERQDSSSNSSSTFEK